jgi:hypothetical protein
MPWEFMGSNGNLWSKMGISGVRTVTKTAYCVKGVLNLGRNPPHMAVMALDVVSARCPIFSHLIRKKVSGKNLFGTFSMPDSAQKPHEHAESQKEEAL